MREFGKHRDEPKKRTNKIIRIIIILLIITKRRNDLIARTKQKSTEK